MLGRLAHRALDLLVAGVADEDDRVALGGELQRLAVDLGDERAGRVDRLQAALGGVGVDRGRDAVGGEDGDRALGDRVVELLDEDGAAGAQLLDDVLVVDDLLAHVDGRAVQLERALDGLHGAVDAGAVAARGGEEQLLREGGGHAPECTRRVLGRPPPASARAELRISSTVVSPTASRLRSESLSTVSRDRVRVAVGEVDEVDRRDAGAQERRVVVEDRRLRRSAGRRAPTPTRAAAARIRRHSAASSVPSRGSRRPRLAM